MNELANSSKTCSLLRIKRVLEKYLSESHILIMYSHFHTHTQKNKTQPLQLFNLLKIPKKLSASTLLGGPG